MHTLLDVSGSMDRCLIIFHSPFSFNFVIDMIIDTTLQGLDNPGVDTMPAEKLVDLEYADDIVLLSTLTIVHSQR